MNIAIVDDDIKDIDRLEELLRLYASLHRNEITVERFQSATEFLSSYSAYKYSLIFLDIYMNGENGVDTAAAIREVDQDTIIIFQTTSADHMSSAFSLHAFDYVMKPVEKDRIFRLMDDVTRQETRDGKTFSFIDKNVECRLRYGDIISLRSNKHYLNITDREMNEYRIRMNFSDAEEELASDGRFLLINRGTLVNMDHITRFGNGICVINDTIHLPYNVKKQKLLEQTYRNYIFSKVHRNMH